MLEMSEKFLKANGQFLDSYMRVGTIAMENQSRIAKHQAAAMEKWVDAGNRQLALMKEARDPAEFIGKAGELVSDFGQEMATMMREAIEMQAELGGNLANAIQEELNQGLVVKEAAKPASKKAA